MQTAGNRALIDDWTVIPRYDVWIESLDIPIHRSYFFDDLRKLPVGPWDERECNAAIVVLAGSRLTLIGQEGLTETRVTEIPPAATLPPLRFALDELVYVLDGAGTTTTWADDNAPGETFEWQAHSVFILPRNHKQQLRNVQDHRPARLLHFNCLPMALSIFPDPRYFFDNTGRPAPVSLDRLYAQPTFNEHAAGWARFWLGGFFPDVARWDKLRPQDDQGFGAETASLVFPDSSLRAGLPTIPPGTYKKAARHGPGLAIVGVTGEGTAVVWRNDGERETLRWGEGSLFAPPVGWWCQHFNTGGTAARYLTLHAPRSISRFDGRGEPANPSDRIEYADEDSAVRRAFEHELAAKGLESRMPQDLYRTSTIK